MFDCTDITSLAKEFATPVSVQAFEELTKIANILQALRMDTSARSEQDNWSSFLQKGTYSSMAFYKFMLSGLQVSVIFKNLWKSNV
jgi:hypothetical protein